MSELASGKPYFRHLDSRKKNTCHGETHNMFDCHSFKEYVQGAASTVYAYGNNLQTSLTMTFT